MTQYPLRENAADTLKTFSERNLNEITSDALRDGDLTADDLRTHGDTLRLQAQIAEDAGYPQLANNLRRAAELTRVPNEEVLKIYEMLRPDRSSWEELNKLADYLENTYQATENAKFIREATTIYKERGILRR
jgi:propanediol dehydratase small subunit